MHGAGFAVGVLRVRRDEDTFGYRLLEGLAGHRRRFRPPRGWNRRQLVGGAPPHHTRGHHRRGVHRHRHIRHGGGCIISNMHARGDQHLDYVVVLGAQVRKSGPSKALRYRLDTAADYLRNSPDTICIVSGGKGANEPFPEAQGMADYLKAHGIEEGRILQESKSKTTQENIVNSKKLIAGDNASVGIITNDFHMFRALQIAHDNGLDEAQGIAAGSPPDMLVNNMVREFFAEIKFLLS